MRFPEVWNCDFEYQRPEDQRDPPLPVCMVARELHSRREIRLFQEELTRLPVPPFNIGADACFVSYSVAAEASCFAVLCWPMPTNILDLYAENLVHLNGKPRHKGDASLLFALERYGLSAMTAMHKEAMRDKILHQSSWTPEEQAEILDYCAEDVDAGERLLLAMERRGDVDWPRALWRGAFMFATGCNIEHHGIPVDADLYFRLTHHWEAIQHSLIERVDRAYGVYVNDSFNRKLFAKWLAAKGIPWPRLESGSLALDQEVFKSQAEAYPILAPLRELTLTLAQMRSTGLTIGADGRNRFWTRPLLSKTGRNQPSTSANILGSAAWLRGLITPPPGHGLALIDWSAQEIAIAAGRSGDPAMCAAYATGDVHMATAIAAGFVPPWATEKTHPIERHQIKCVSLGTNYGITRNRVAAELGISRLDAEILLQAHRDTYPVFWRWLAKIIDTAMLASVMVAPMGWRMAITGEPNRRSIQNWTMQTIGAEMMRAAVVKMVRAGLYLCATAHDAIMIQAPLESLKTDVALAQSIMERISLSFTQGLLVRTEAKVLRPGERMIEKRGERMWSLVIDLLADVETYEMHQGHQTHAIRPIRPMPSEASDPSYETYQRHQTHGTHE